MIDGDDRHEDTGEGDLREADDAQEHDRGDESSADEGSHEEAAPAEAETVDETEGDSPVENPASEDASIEESPAADTSTAEAPAEEQPAMALEGGSDEGGTLEDAAEEAHDEGHELAAAPAEPEVPAEPEHTPEPEPTLEAEAPIEQEEPIEPETFAETESFEGSALDEIEEEPVFDDDELGLVSDDDALPWLESSDYDDIESVDAWRITGFVVMGLVFLALLVGGFWYFTNRDNDGQPIADGSVIEAPEGPYKERPEDPGGKTFEGTGDMAPAVGEGEKREGRLAEKSATPEPVAKPVEKPAETPKAPVANDNRIAVQVGAYRDTSTAEAGWRAINRQTDALAGVEYRIVKGEADIGTVYRLQALPGDMAAARRLSEALKADGVASQIKQ